jgi:hypothetical protein
MSYTIVPLKEVIEELGEEAAEGILSDFTCPQNQDVEDFLRKTAISFNKQAFSKTHLVFAQQEDERVFYACAKNDFSAKRGADK